MAKTDSPYVYAILLQNEHILSEAEAEEGKCIRSLSESRTGDGDRDSVITATHSLDLMVKRVPLPRK